LYFYSENRKLFKEKLKKLIKKSNWELLLELTRANFKERDHNSLLGILWSFLGPVALTAVMYVVFKTHFGTTMRAYPLYLLIGVNCVGFFVTATSYILKILVTNRSFILDSTVPREAVITASFAVHAVKFLIETALCVIISLVIGLLPVRFLWLGIPLIVSFSALVLGVGLFLSVFFIFTADIEHLWTLTTRLIFFATPIFFSLESLSRNVRNAVFFLNPVAPFLISLREIIMGPDFHSGSYLYSLILGFVVFFAGYGTFALAENSIAEKV